MVKKKKKKKKYWPANAGDMETHFQFLSWEDPLEESMATHPSILDWRILKDRGA